MESKKERRKECKKELMNGEREGKQIKKGSIS